MSGYAWEPVDGGRVAPDPHRLGWWASLPEGHGLAEYGRSHPDRAAAEDRLARFPQFRHVATSPGLSPMASLALSRANRRRREQAAGGRPGDLGESS